MHYPVSYWKAIARAALKNHWQTAMLIALAVNLPSLLVQALASATGNDLMLRLQDALYSAMSPSGAVNETQLVASLRALTHSSGLWVMQALGILAWLLTPCLVLGMYHWMLQRLRGEEDPGVSAVLSRAGIFLKSIGLRLMISLRIFLFMLPGVVLCVLSFLPIWLTPSGASLSSALSAIRVSGILFMLSVIAMLILGVWAALRFGLADLLMADQPKSGIREVIRRSRELMRGNQFSLLTLMLSFILWYLLEALAVSFCAGAFGSVPGLMVEMLASLALDVYMAASVCAFARTLLGEGSVPAAEIKSSDPQ